MAHNRLEKVGTIYSRITGLIRSGAMKIEDRPLWYEVYQAFPPKVEPSYERASHKDTPIRKIFYPEDVIRAKFYKRFSNLQTVNLSDNANQTLCQKCIDLTLTIRKEKEIDLDAAFDEAFSQLKEEGNSSRKPGPQSANNNLNIKQILEET